MSRPTGRVLTLLELLQAGGTRTVAELADRLGVDGRTVRRYVGHLVDLDVPVESVRGRYGGYRLSPGYRLPPLMLDDDEALAVLLGLVAGPRTGLATAQRTAAETAAAKIRRVLPRHVARRLDALLDSLSFTGRTDLTDRAGRPDLTGHPDRPDTAVAPEAEVLLTLADAVRHRRPVAVRYTDRNGSTTERTLHPYGIVAHGGRWYVTGEDPGIGEDRTFRLDRITGARAQPGTFDAPAGPDPAQRVLSGFATAGYRHEVVVRIRATAERIRVHLPGSVATLEDSEPAPEPGPRAEPGAGAGARTGTGTGTGGDGTTEGWTRVALRAERLDWLPPVLAAIDRPFVIERPEELRTLVAAFADRLASHARRT
ncbi:helix-turn-helix transcriptional regulator [Kitasatospora sp. NPDC059577]|uniref:helix-turn-helix transcriptional regulator n=1 Tax=Kitasatospora sp. NPDC059577 TaxID=3346873 RepID=UPI0036C1A77A